MGIEECQRLAGLDGLDPQRRLAQLDRERITVDTVDAVLDHLAQRVLPCRLVRCVHACLDAGDLGSHASRRSQEKVSRTARWVENLDVEDGRAGIARVTGERLGENGFERRFDQFVYQGRWSVIGPGQLSLGAPGPLAVFVPDETESPGRCVHVQDGLKFQQTLVDRAELLGSHVAVVDAC